MAGKYEDLDNRIIKLIEMGCRQYGRICCKINDYDDRAVDRRLQAMRKKGLIEFAGQSWGWRVLK